MADQLNQFSWTGAVSGYRVLPLKSQGEHAERPYLTSAVPIGRRYEGFTYTPSAGLFIKLAQLKPEQDQILEFANQYGMLTGGVWLDLDGVDVYGEPLELWTAAIADLSVAHGLWDLLKSGATSKLGQYIKWRDASGVRFAYADRRGGRWIATRETNLDLLQTFRPGDLIGPAWHQLQYMVNEKLEGAVSARLLWNSSHTRLGLYQVPNDLISALWLQFARALDGDREYVQCEECRNWFEVSSPDGGRKDKRFCGTACRARFWRKLKKGEKGDKE